MKAPERKRTQTAPVDLFSSRRPWYKLQSALYSKGANPPARFPAPILRGYYVESDCRFEIVSKAKGFAENISMRNRQVLAVVEDLLFTVKISDAAKRAGLISHF